MSDLASPGSHYTYRVIGLAVGLVVEGGLSYRAASWHLWRDHRVFVPFATIQNWVEALLFVLGLVVGVVLSAYWSFATPTFARSYSSSVDEYQVVRFTGLNEGAMTTKMNDLAEHGYRGGVLPSVTLPVASRRRVSPASCRRAAGRGPSPCTSYPLLHSRAELPAHKIHPRQLTRTEVV